MRKKNWILLFLPILFLTSSASLVSLFTSDFYFRDSKFIALKSHCLDIINLVIVVPIGIIMFVLAMKKSYWAKLFVIGTMAYLAFMFGFNSLSLYFNQLFLVYVALFGLSVFGIIFGYGDVQQTGNCLENGILTRISGVFLMLFALVAYAAWLIEVVTATTNGSMPDSIQGMNLPVNVIHVFDMAFALPIILIGAILLLRNRMSGLIISTIMAAFVFLTCISMLGMELALKYHNMPIDAAELYSYYLLTPLSAFSLVFLYRAVSKLPSSTN